MFDESIDETHYWKDPIDITKEQWMFLLVVPQEKESENR